MTSTEYSLKLKFYNIVTIEMKNPEMNVSRLGTDKQLMSVDLVTSLQYSV